MQQRTRIEELAEGWRYLASCRGLDTNLFFPPGSAAASWVALNEAKRICEHCPVQQPCLQWAIAAGVTDDIWGGLTARERRTHQQTKKRPQPN